jgi:hypothetical protein
VKRRPTARLLFRFDSLRQALWAVRIPPGLNRMPAIPVPISGAMMNSHTCPSAAGLVPIADDRRSERARRVDRNPRHVDADDMDGDQGQPDGEAGELRRNVPINSATGFFISVSPI